MSDEKKDLTTTGETPVSEATENAITVESKTIEMTAENYQKWNRDAQLGLTDELPDGRSIKEFQKHLQDQQLAQEAERRKAALPEGVETTEKGNIVTSSLEADTPMEVTIHANGAVTATPKAEVLAEIIANTNASDGDDDDADNDQEAPNDLPKDLAGRRALLIAGHTDFEKVRSFSLEDLIGIAGIKDATAQKILDYGKSV